ncbi:MAG: Fic family protein [Sphingobacteriales bacterium]|jgi:Fic family protein
MFWQLTELPLQNDIESKAILKKLPMAHAALAELKGVAASIPNQEILINSLGLQEAKDSSAIENIITTHDELFLSELNLDAFSSLQAKEVQNYIAATKKGFELISETGLLTNSSITKIQQVLEANNAGFRKVPGTALKNAATGEEIYLPPQNHDDIVRLMGNLEHYINQNDLSDFDPIVKMAIIHFQFESIHPFYDCNGRTGRIINILYLILQGLQTLPILYLSSYIIKNKQQYYTYLQQVRDTGNWESWLLFMIEAVQVTARQTIDLVIQIQEQMRTMKKHLKANYKFYSQDLLNNLFKHPYTKIDFLVQELGVSRLTAANYLNKLADDGILRKEKLGTANYYINEPLFTLLSRR